MSEEVIADRFEIVRLAGQGGMGTVFRAIDRATKDAVALKIVEGAHANARFAREAQVLAALDHPSIVRYVAHGPLPKGRMYLAMEWLEGMDLAARLDVGALSLDDALSIGRTLASALGAAHSAGIVHRDVKPSNVLLRDGDPRRAVLVDFGIARAAKATIAVTKTGAVIGTPAYMAPEQARGDKGVDSRADVFSLGCVLFECLCGRPAFVGEHVVAVLAKILLDPAPRLSSLRPDLPRSLDTLVAAMLAKEPRARPPNGDVVARALEVLDTNTTNPSLSIAPRSVGIGSTERRFATIILASPHTQKAVGHADTEDALAGLTEEAAVFDIGSTQGITITPLANGMFVGAVVAEEGARDAAERAVRCALALASRAPDVTIAVGSGRAIVADQVPVGDVIDRAARLLAKYEGHEGRVIVDEATKSIVEATFEVTEIDESNDGFVAARERGATERGRTVLGRVVPFVGRDRELALLESSFRQCVDEPVALASLVVAPPGTGKSRLARELVARVSAASDEAPPAVWTALAQPATQRTPFAFANDLFRRVLGIVEGEPVEQRRARAVQRVREVVAADASARVTRFLAELVGAPFADDDADPAIRAARRAPELMRAQIEDAVATFMTAELAKRPVLVVAEDIHWADAASVALLGMLLTRAKDRPFMVLALARPAIDEVHPDVWRDVRCERIVLSPLLRKASEKLARAVLGDHPEIDAIVKRAEGNALFVEELARACAEGRAASDLPPTVVAATEARLAAMDPETRQLVRAASIFGERFWAGGVAHLVGGSPLVAERLMRLERLELVSRAPESRFAGERELVFRHALVRDAAYGMFTDEDRALGHALAGEWLAERVEDAALLAYHFENGGRSAEAARQHVRAADQALLVQDVDAVHRHAARAHALGATPAELATARAAEADAYLWVGEHRAAAVEARRAIESLPRASQRWFEALAVGLVSSGKLGDRATFGGFVDELERTRATEPRAGCARAIACARAAIQCAYFSMVEKADTLLEACEHEPGANGDPGVAAWLLAAQCERGTAAGEPVHPSVPRRARELCEGIGDTRGAFGHWGSELQLFATIGAFAEAADCGTKMVAATGGKARSLVFYARSTEVVIEADAGQFEGMFAFIDELRKSASPRLLEYFTSTTAQFLVAHGRYDEAERYANEVVRALEHEPLVGPLAVSYASLSRVATKRGDAARALAYLAKLGSQAERPTMVASAIATVFLARYEALEASGRLEEGKAVLAAGVAHMDRCSKNLREYRKVFFSSYDAPLLFEHARAHGIEVPAA